MAAGALRVGLIGAGRIGRLHAGHLAHRVADATLVAVADPVVELAQACAREHGIPVVSSEYRDLLASADVQAIVICSSTDTHAQIIAEAARVLKPGGRVLLVDLLEHEQVELQQRFGQRWPGFASSDIEAWITKAGLAEARVVPLPPEMKARGPLLFAAAARKPQSHVRSKS